jgi:hypothetical protein
MRKKYYEPDVLNTPIIMLALSDEFKHAAGKSGFDNFQQMIDKKEKVLDGSAFPVSLQGELFEYAEYHEFLGLFGVRW